MANPKVRYEITAVDKSKSAINSAKSGLGGLGKAFGALSALAAAAGITSFVSSTLKSVDNIAKLSTQLGISTEKLSAYQFVADQTGVSFQTLTTGLQRMTRRVSEAAKGGGPAVEVLKELGVNAEHLNMLAPDKQFSKLADALNKVESSNDRVRIAFGLFDSDGVKLLRTTKNGSEGLEKMSESFKSMGGEIDGNTAKSVEAFNDKISKLGERFKGVGLKIFDNLLPHLNDFVDFVDEHFDCVVNSVKDVGKAFEDLEDIAKKSFGSIKNLIGDFSSNFDSAINLFSRFESRTDALNRDSQFIQGVFSQLPQRATGGPVTSGKPFLVGERGPELFVPNTNGNIVPNFSSNVNVNVNGRADNLALLEEAISRSVRASVFAISQDFRTNGPLRQSLPV